MPASIFPLSKPSGIYSLRFRQAGTCTGNFSDNGFQFLQDGNISEPIGGVQSGASPATASGRLEYRPILPGSVIVRWNKPATATSENPTPVPPEDGATLTFVITLAHHPVARDLMTIAWKESTVSKTATLDRYGQIAGANAANVASMSINRVDGILNISFNASHAPDADSIRVTYVYSGTAASVTDDSRGNFTGAGIQGTVNYATGDISVTLTGAGVVPYDGDIITVDYSGLQAWSKGIRIKSAAGGYVEFSFDGTNVHGKVSDGAEAEYLDRYEPGIAIRGSGAFVVEAW